MIRQLHETVDRIKGRSITVLGDYMLDRYIVGDVSRISPEAPVPVVRVEKENHVPGGAGNVVRNLAALGAVPQACGVIGDDEAGVTLSGLLGELGADVAPLVRTTRRGTTTKTRVIGNRQQICRVDFDHNAEPDGEIYAQLLEGTFSNIENADAVVLSDYAKGVLSEALSSRIIHRARELGVEVCVDPKPEHVPRFHGATLISPNELEAAETTRTQIADDAKAIEAAKILQAENDLEVALITRGAKGMCLYERGGPAHLIPAIAAEVFDVTGAGDTAISVVTACIAAGASFLHAALIANIAGGEVVQHIGCATVTRERLHELIEEQTEIFRRIETIETD
ncbi:MAG: D-glycero-beta-D-manno-heptose-7-phosphate kinase [Armatimonadota bacterium]